MQCVAQGTVRDLRSPNPARPAEAYRVRAWLRRRTSIMTLGNGILDHALEPRTAMSVKA